MSWTDYLNPLYDIRKGTDQLGITHPDLPTPTNITDPSNPAYRNLLSAAGAFNRNYRQANVAQQQAQAQTQQAQQQQQQTIDTLRDAAAGKTPSAAENLMRSATDANARNAINAAAAFQGTNPGEALRAGLTGAQQTQAQAVSQIGAQRAAEQDAARQSLTAATGQNQNAAGANYGTATSGVANAANAFNSANQAPFNAQLGNQQNMVQANAANEAASGQFYSGLAKAAATASDPELKTDVHDGGKMSDDFLAALAPKEFRYTPGHAAMEDAPGKRLGVMADELPRHDVVTGPDGKKWISATAISDILGGLGRLHQRVSAVEAARAFA